MAATYRQNGGAITITTPRPHRLCLDDQVFLSFTGSPAPAAQIYQNLVVDSPTTFRVNAPGVSVGTYNQSGALLTVTSSNHGLAAGQQVYLAFTTGGALNGVYTVTAVPGASVFTVTSLDSAARSGACLFPNWAGNFVLQSGTTITVIIPGAHGLAVGNNVFIRFPDRNPATNGVYRITGVPAPNRFTVNSSVSVSRMDRNALVLPLAAPRLVRSGVATLRYSTWNMNATDNPYTWNIYQSPLRSPTVFNFFSPDYRFPGVLASAGLTTPEFQLTTDSSVVLQLNFFLGSVFNNYNNTNGLSSLTAGSGAIALDLGPWMTPNQLSDAGIPLLVDNLNSLLCAGQLSSGAKDVIVHYVAGNALPYTTPTAGELRDRLRSVVHLIVTSPDFIIQR